MHCIYPCEWMHCWFYLLKNWSRLGQSPFFQTKNAPTRRSQNKFAYICILPNWSMLPHDSQYKQKNLSQLLSASPPISQRQNSERAWEKVQMDPKKSSTQNLWRHCCKLKSSLHLSPDSHLAFLIGRCSNLSAWAADVLSSACQWPLEAHLNRRQRIFAMRARQ